MKKEKIYNYFYIINNLKNGRFYLGVHSTNKLADGYFGSGKLLKIAIKNYGKENFEITPLKFFGTRKELLAFEKEIVNEQFLKYYKGICYNLKKGGEGGRDVRFSDEELRQHHCEADRKYKQTPAGKESHHKYIQSPKGKARRREYNRKWREQNPEYHRQRRAKKKAEKLAAQQGIII